MKVDASNPQKSLWETGDQLTVWTMTGSECSTANMSENGFTLISGANTGTGKFSGRLKSTSAPTSTTPLIAVIDNGSDAINASDGNSVTANLATQVGATAESALDYELYYATSTNATRNFNFTHKMALIKWTIKVNGVSDGDKCDIVLSGTGLKNSATLDPKTGNLTVAAADGTITLQNVSLNAGNTELYVVLPPCTVSSGITAELIMTSGSKAGKKATGTLGVGAIKVEENMYYTAGNEFTPAVNDFTSLAPGDVIYADNGTTPIAVTVYQSGGHGYAIALEDCATSNCSATANGDYYFTWDAVTTNICLNKNGTLYTDAIADMNGKGNTSILPGDSHTHYAAKAASTYKIYYNGSYQAVIPDDAPSGAAWVLPSAGQWFQLMKTFGVSASDFAAGNQLNVTTNNFGYINGNNNGEYYTNMNSNLISEMPSGFTFTPLADRNTYWSSSECYGDGAVGVYFNSSYGFTEDYYLKSFNSRVRAFLAF